VSLQVRRASKLASAFSGLLSYKRTFPGLYGMQAHLFFKDQLMELVEVGLEFR
jgi:hypothetical protein